MVRPKSSYWRAAQNTHQAMLPINSCSVLVQQYVHLTNCSLIGKKNGIWKLRTWGCFPYKQAHQQSSEQFHNSFQHRGAKRLLGGLWEDGVNDRKLRTKTQLRQWEPILLAWSDYVEPESINNNIMTETFQHPNPLLWTANVWPEIIYLFLWALFWRYERTLRLCVVLFTVPRQICYKDSPKKWELLKYSA